jgi:hypothetical protein
VADPDRDEHLRDLDTALFILSKLTQDYDDCGRLYGERPALPAARPVQDELCDWEHGVCLCPGCGAVVRVLPRAGQAARVVDADHREHYCGRTVAATLQQHGLALMGPQLARHADRPPLDQPRPSPPPVAPPKTNGHVRTPRSEGSGV